MDCCFDLVCDVCLRRKEEEVRFHSMVRKVRSGGRSHWMPAGQAADDEEPFRCRQNGNIMLDLNMQTHATTFLIVPTEPILRCY